MISQTKYQPVDNHRRHELIRLIYEDNVSIRQAAIRMNISYPTAKAINRIYKQEDRVDKKKHRVRRLNKAHTADVEKQVASCDEDISSQQLFGKQQTEKPDRRDQRSSLADRIKSIGMHQLRRLDVGTREMSMEEAGSDKVN